MSELIVITGPRGVGKSRLAATRPGPDELSKTFVHDSEQSMNDIREKHEKLNVSFGHYTNLQNRFPDLPGEGDLLDRINAGQLPWVDARGRSALIGYYEHITQDLADNLARGEFKYYIHDTGEKLEAGIAAWVEANKRDSGVKSTAYGRLWTDGVYPLYEHFLEAIWDRGVDTIILNFHLKTPWENNRPVPGKVVPAGKKLLWFKSRLYLWLVDEPRNSDGAPAGIVMKERMGDLAIVEKSDGSKVWAQRRMLPRRIPHCTWEDIRRYLVNGCDLRNPEPGEDLSDSERAMISELLTDEQMRLMIADAERDLAEARQNQAVISGGGSFSPPNGNDESDNARSDDAKSDDAALNPLELTIRDMLDKGMDVDAIVSATGRPRPIIKALVEKVK